MSIYVEDTGDGPALLFLPGSYSTLAAWKPVQSALTTRCRMITTGLPGYGQNAECRPGNVADMTELVDWLAELIAQIGTPVHVVGHSFGGLIALAAAHRGDLPLQSVITFEANPVFIRLHDNDRPWRPALRDLQTRFARAVATRDPDAPGLIIDHWTQPGAFASLPGTIQDFCRAHAATNLLDWQSASGFNPRIESFESVFLPVTIVRGEAANPAISDVSAGLAETIPGARHRIVPGADHFLINTHGPQCAALVAEHMERLGGAAG